MTIKFTQTLEEISRCQIAILFLGPYLSAHDYLPRMILVLAKGPVRYG